MATETIPKKTVIICDVCGKRSDEPIDDFHRNDGFSTKSRFTLMRTRLDEYGVGVADASVSRDLCDQCAEELSKVVNAWAKEKEKAE